MSDIAGKTIDDQGWPKGFEVWHFDRSNGTTNIGEPKFILRGRIVMPI